jgi:hypothetical protein
VSECSRAAYVVVSCFDQVGPLIRLMVAYPEAECGRFAFAPIALRGSGLRRFNSRCLWRPAIERYRPQPGR